MPVLEEFEINQQEDEELEASKGDTVSGVLT